MHTTGIVTIDNSVLSTIPFVQHASSAMFSFAINVTILATGMDNCSTNTPKITGSAVINLFINTITRIGNITIRTAVNKYILTFVNITFRFTFAIDIPIIIIDNGMVALPI